MDNSDRFACSGVVAAVLLCVLAAGCGSSAGTVSEKQARAVWAYVRTAVSRREARSVAGRNRICAVLTNELIQRLARRYGASSGSGCAFVARVPELDGSIALGELTHLRSADAHTLRATYSARIGRHPRDEAIEFREVNPHHWLITELLGEHGTHD